MNICFFKNDNLKTKLRRVDIKNVETIEFDGSDLILSFSQKNFNNALLLLKTNHYNQSGRFITIESSFSEGCRDSGFNGYIIFDIYYPFFEIYHDDE